MGTLPENRLIWTSDNIVALQTLIDERIPRTREYRYRGKVDLVYIDPPFMVQNDFRAENTIDIELDEEEQVAASKEPGLVEILAYKDTWRQGLDSFLSMLRARLVLLRELLSPTGSIYVHLDWHAVHYVKLLMDEIFGYKKFRNEIIWHYNSGGRSKSSYSFKHDTMLVYATGDEPFFDYRAVGEDRGAEKRNHMKRGVDADNRSYWSIMSAGKLYKYYDDEKLTPDDVWNSISHLQQKDPERLQYPTQKPRKLVERVISGASHVGDLVLDCFVGSGTTAEAAERLGRAWIAIDNSKYAVHLTRKRLIQLHGRPRSGEAPQVDFVQCEACKHIERREKPQRSGKVFKVRPFTVENMGVYQRAESWQGFQTERTRYRDEMLKVFGAEVVEHSTLLHGRKERSWVHVGPLDAAITAAQVWSIARQAKGTDCKAVTILSADFDTLSGSEKDEIKAQTDITVTIRIIPASAIDEVRRRLEIQRGSSDESVESMAIPAFYAPLAITLRTKVSKRIVTLTLDRCEVDIDSFIASQQPALKPIAGTMSAIAKKKARTAIDKWEIRRKELDEWLQKANTWRKFIDFWAIDWEYGSLVGADDKPIFETDWQSFRVRRAKETDPIAFSAEYECREAGQHRVAARVTDVFGNDGIATVTVQVK